MHIPRTVERFATSNKDNSLSKVKQGNRGRHINAQEAGIFSAPKVYKKKNKDWRSGDKARAISHVR